ncbi:MAG: aldo/keto reductase [Atopobiaceae bacterium]|nr:aldo/keto reductase [Atopobiaceae bacterium]
MEYIELNDGNRIPAIGFGVFMIPADGPTYEATLAALEAGYRHIDTAAAYMNEQDVGRAVRDSGIPREEIFVTSKLWPQDYAAADAPAGIRRTLDNLGFDYIDLMLLHQPYGPVDEAWAALEKAKEQGLVRSIGVSNMTPKIWNQWVPGFKTLPAINQVECNPTFQQRALRDLLDPLALSSSAGTRWDTAIPSCWVTQQSPVLQPSMARMPARLFCASRRRRAWWYCPNPPVLRASSPTSMSLASS